MDWDTTMDWDIMMDWLTTMDWLTAMDLLTTMDWVPSKEYYTAIKPYATAKTQSMNIPQLVKLYLRIADDTTIGGITGVTLRIETYSCGQSAENNIQGRTAFQAKLGTLQHT
jgi:hypothetical protein